MADKTSPGQKLRDLISTGETILLPGAHDPLMGRIVQRLGFKACIYAGWMTGAHLATPEPVMTMTEQVDVAGRVARALDIPVKSDAGAGYGDPIHVIRAVQEFERAGIAAIQIEDQVFPKRGLVPPGSRARDGSGRVPAQDRVRHEGARGRHSDLRTHRRR